MYVLLGSLQKRHHQNVKILGDRVELRKPPSQISCTLIGQFILKPSESCQKMSNINEPLHHIAMAGSCFYCILVLT